MISNLKQCGLQCVIQLGFCDHSCLMNLSYIIPSFKKYWQQNIVWPQSQLETLKTTKHVKKILLNNDFSKYIWQSLFSQIIEISLNDCFNQILPDLPPRLKMLHLGGCFNQYLPDLPIGLTSLNLGQCFNKNLPRISKIRM